MSFKICSQCKEIFYEEDLFRVLKMVNIVRDVLIVVDEPRMNSFNQCLKYSALKKWRDYSIKM
jgi:hypothetical protein